MDFTDPNSDVIVSHYDAKAVEKAVVGLTVELSNSWLAFFGESFDKVLGKLADDDQNGAQQAFLDALKEGANLSDEMGRKIAETVSRLLGDMFQIAYNEGAAEANSLTHKTLRKLIAEGKLEDEHGYIEKFIQISEKTLQEHMDTVMKGRNLNIYTVPKKGDEDGVK